MDEAADVLFFDATEDFFDANEDFFEPVVEVFLTTPAFVKVLLDLLFFVIWKLIINMFHDTVLI